MDKRELIQLLKDVPDDTKIALWEWNGERSTFRQLTPTNNAYDERRKVFSLTTPVPKMIDPLYLEV